MKALESSIEAGSYHDFSALGAIKGQARSQPNDQAALRAAAQQFEALFVQEVMKSMREANAPMKSELLDSHAMETFQGMMDKEVSVQLAKRGGLGVADMLVQQMSKRPPEPSAQDMLQMRQGAQAFELNPPSEAMPLNKPGASAGFDLSTPRALRLPRTPPLGTSAGFTPEGAP